MRPILIAAASLLTAAILAGDLSAHGGLYRGPSPSLPPGVAPPPGGTPASGPGIPATSGASVWTAGKKNAGQDYTRWKIWWEFNKHPYLNLRARLASNYTVTGLGRQGVEAAPKSDSTDTATSSRPSFAELKEQVLPVLRELLAEKDPDIVDSAVLAIARMTPAEHGAEVFDDIKGALAHPARSVKQSSILALGVLGHADAVPLLLEILDDSSEGRRLMKVKQEIDEVQRAMAAVALGYLSDPQAIAALNRVIDKNKDSKLDLKASSILSLGLFDDGQYEIVPLLLELLDDRKLSETIQAQVPIAVGRLGETARPMLPMLLKMTRSRKTRTLVRQSCVVALGRLAAPEDTEIVEALIEVARKSTDQASSNLAFVALGEIGARAAAEPTRHEEMLKELDRFLLRQVTRPRKKSMLAWSATACALVGRAYPADHQARRVYEQKLTSSWEGTRNPEQRAALTICLGLIEAKAMGPRLLKTLRKSADRSVNGHIAEALGMMRHEGAKAELQKIMGQDGDAEYRVQLATGLGLMGDPDVAELLVQEISRARTLWVTSSVAKALGNVGDRSALAPLIELTLDDSRPGLARAFGVVALGLIGEKTPLPWNSRVTIGSNYIAAFYAQTEIMDIL